MSAFGYPCITLRRVVCTYRRRTLSTAYVSPLKESTIPTDYFQSSLPRLKVPELAKSVDRYIDSQRAVLDSSELKKTAAFARKFLTERGPQLQTQLTNFANDNRHTSYISKMWFDMYLRDRRPVALTHNPVLIMKDTNLGSDYAKPLVRATNVVYSILRFCQLLRSNRLEPEVYHLDAKKSKTQFFNRTIRLVPKSLACYAAYLFKAYPLDMSQYSNMFNATRIPQPVEDRLFVDSSARHLLVIYRGQMYAFDVFDQYGGVVSPRQLLSNISFILQQPVLINTPGLGTITALPRDEVFKARERLKSLGNEGALQVIDSALFALVLDDEYSPDMSSLLSNFLAGPSHSRWFDKSFSLLVDRAGRVGVNFEHSWGDGVAIVRLCNDVYFDSEFQPAVNPRDLQDRNRWPNPSVRRLEWLLDGRTKTELLTPGRQAYDERRKLLEVGVAIRTNSLSKSLCKRAGLSPDAMMQLSFQVAFDKLHGRPAATYESCSTAAFKHGRTEALRSATPETREFVQLMRKPVATVSSHSGGRPAPNATSDEDLYAALKVCSLKHNQLTKEAVMGQGWDRHFFALYNFAKADTGRALPELFLDENYTNINRIILSTSTLASPAFYSGCFAPVQPDGYGIGYGFEEEQCGLFVTSWRNSPVARAVQFADAFIQVADRISSILLSRSAF
ncbi:unnamed protein product [Calicophoron daubneyi]|uniref:Choline/carnitine acyltransferase domain-containing protein n=1 Tax=Calicophoron daubneyi TaxID=300641 RepID=A0AAV2TWJ4_CALDB